MRRASELQYTGWKDESNRIRPTMAGFNTFTRIIRSLLIPETDLQIADSPKTDLE